MKGQGLTDSLEFRLSWYSSTVYSKFSYEEEGTDPSPSSTWHNHKDRFCLHSLH